MRIGVRTLFGTSSVLRQSHSLSRAPQASHVKAAGLPLTDTISSIANNYVKHCCKLRASRAYREQSGSVLIVGQTPIQELAGKAAVRVLFLAEGAAPLPGVHAASTVVVSEAVLRKLSNLESVTGLRAVAELDAPAPVHYANDYQPGQVSRLLALERVQDPGNLGTLTRTAAALGWDGLFLLPGCCDPYNEKALRASRGASFKLPLCAGTWEDLELVTGVHGLACLGAEPEVGNLQQGGSPSSLSGMSSGKQGVCLVLGSEGQGLSAHAKARCLPVSVPMSGNMESLNVSHAGAILMFVLKSMPIEAGLQLLGVPHQFK